MSNKHFIGKRLFSFSDNGLRDPVSRVTLLVDDENSVTAGDDTGLELLANCPYADETLAQALLNQVKGYQYRAFNAQSADLDPAAELGDGITADGVYSILAGLTDNGDGYPDISAPGDREEEDEYPEGGPLTRLFNRQLATTRSLISKTSEEIRLEVTSLKTSTSKSISEIKKDLTNLDDEFSEALENLDGEFAEKLKQYSTITQTATSITAAVKESKEYTDQSVGDLDSAVSLKLESYSTIEQTANSITAAVKETKEYTDQSVGDLDSAVSLKLESYSTLEQTSNSITAMVKETKEYTDGKITTVTEKYALLEQTVDGINATVKGAQDDISALKIRADGIEASVSSVQTGLSQTVRIASDGVTITNAAGSKLTIDGGQINAENLNLTGRIAFGDLTSTVQNDIDEAWKMAYDAQDTASDAADTVDAWRYDGGTYIDSSMIMVTTLMATELLGGEVALLTSSERQAGGLDITGSSSSTYAIELWSNGALRLVADDGDLYMEAGGEYITIGYVQGEGYPIVVSNTLMPATDGNINLGNYTYYWANAYIEQCYGSAEAASTSDRNKKHDISYDLDRYDPFFDGLQPCIFKLDNGTSGRYHTGLVAQDVELMLAECGIPTSDFAGFIKMEDSYALRYGEFIALLIWQVQKLKARVKELEVRL